MKKALLLKMIFELMLILVNNENVSVFLKYFKQMEQYISDNAMYDEEFIVGTGESHELNLNTNSASKLCNSDH